MGLGEEPLAKLWEAWVAVAEQQVKGGADEPLGQAAEGGAELGQGGGGDPEVFVGEPEAGGATGLVTSGAPGVMEAQRDGEVAHGPLATAQASCSRAGASRRVALWRRKTFERVR